MQPIRPDLSARPFDCTVERTLKASPEVVYSAFTVQFDKWFAAPGTLILNVEINAPFFFETRFAGERHPHYGRYLKLVPHKQLELTWVTGNPGTLGAETVVSIDLESHGGGTRIKLTHAGFPNGEARDGHAAAWPEVFAHLDRCMAEQVN
jgi:uncharacterized protein YndB with AHSA1/START domain